MALAYDAVTPYIGTVDLRTGSFTHTPVGTPKLIVAGLVMKVQGPGAGLYFKYDGVAMTLVATIKSNEYNLWFSLFYIMSPASGAKTANYFTDQVDPQWNKAWCSSWTGINPQYNTYGTHNIRSVDPVCTIATAKIGIIVGGFGSLTMSQNCTPNDTEIVHAHTNSPEHYAAYTMVTADGSDNVSMDWVTAGDYCPWACVAANFYDLEPGFPKVFVI